MIHRKWLRKPNSRERFVSFIIRAHHWVWGDDADTRSKTFGYCLVAVLFAVIVVAAIR